MPYIQRDGVNIHFEVKGSGPALILTHSFFCSGKMWRAQVAELSRRYRVINVDIRGHGLSTRTAMPRDLYDLVADNLAILDSLGIREAVWGGLSIGGMIALRAALTQPERVKGLILVDTDAGSETALNILKYRMLAAGMLALSNLGLTGPLPRLVAPSMFGRACFRRDPQLIAEWLIEFGRAHIPSMHSFMKLLCRRDSVLERLGEIRVPTLVLVGAQDRALPPKCSRRIHERIAGAELRLIPECGHLSALEWPDEVSRRMLAFLDKLEPAAALSPR